MRCHSGLGILEDCGINTQLILTSANNFSFWNFGIVLKIAVSVLTYPFMLVADLMAVNNCG